jgi:ABC-type Fe3+/spermidine/putrescine transport system ATPase subunit
VFETSDASISARSTPREPYEPPESAFVAGFMGEAMLFEGIAEAAGRVRVGPLVVQARRPVRAGAVKVAVRPEAWQVGPLAASPCKVVMRWCGQGLPTKATTNWSGDEDRRDLAGTT